MFRQIRFQVLQLNSFQIALLTIWALLMVSIPIADWPTGWSAMIEAITVGVSITVLLVIGLLWKAWGATITLQVAGSIFVLSWVAEVIGSHTSMPFGNYRYTDALQPQIFDVPIQIPLGWLMMLPPSWAVAQAISDQMNPRWNFPVFVVLSALAMTAWDLFLDPIMVTWEVWAWDNPGGYFGIPWINFFGWMLVSALITVLIRPGKLPIVPLLIIYTAIWLLKSSGLGFFWGLPGAAFVGSFVMGSLTILAWRAMSRKG